MTFILFVVIVQIQGRLFAIILGKYTREYS